LVIGLAIALPLANAEKLMRWLPPYGADPNNVFQVAGSQLAQTSMAILSQNRAAEVNLLPVSRPENPATATGTLSIVANEHEFLAPFRPYRILLAGDSFMAVAGGFGDILEQKLVTYEQVSVSRKGKVSSGLSRPDYFDWNKESLAAIAEFKPNVAIIMMGTNDAQSFEMTGENGKKQIISYGTPLWDDEYVKRAKSFIKEFTANGSIVYWIGLPAMRDRTYDEKIRHLSNLQDTAIQDDPQARFISSEALMAGKSGPYQPFMADTQGVMRSTRNIDGIHLTYFGGTVLVEKILDFLKDDLELVTSEKQNTPKQGG
jgi:hypothetical protein